MPIIKIDEEGTIGSGDSQNCRLGIRGQTVFIEVEFTSTYEAMVAFEDFRDTLASGRGILIGQAKDMKKEC